METSSHDLAGFSEVDQSKIAVSQRKRFLIWSVCVGERCLKLAQIWMASILDVGQWKHDIALIGDSSIHSISHSQLITIDVVEEFRAKYHVPDTRWAPNTFHSLKPLIQFHINLSAYDYLLYLDIDVLVCSKRLNSILESKQSRKVICVQKGINLISSKKTCQGGRILTDREISQWGDYSICAGIVGFPVTPSGLKFIKDWHELNHAGRFHRSDQGNLIALLLRQYSGKWEYLEDAIFGRELIWYKETFIHFAAQKDDLLRQYAKRALQLQLSDDMTTRVNCRVRN